MWRELFESFVFLQTYLPAMFHQEDLQYRARMRYCWINLGECFNIIYTRNNKNNIDNLSYSFVKFNKKSKYAPDIVFFPSYTKNLCNIEITINHT